jgi:uncharacterized membrane protein
MDFKTLNKQRLYLLAASAVGVIGMFLNWISIDLGEAGAYFNMALGNINGWDVPGGSIFFIAILAAGVLAFLGNQKETLTKNAWLLTLLAGAVAVLFTIFKLFKLMGSAGSSIGIGLWLSTLSGIAVIAVALMFKNPKHDLKQSLNDLKDQVSNKIDNDPNT